MLRTLSHGPLSKWRREECSRCALNADRDVRVCCAPSPLPLSQWERGKMHAGMRALRRRALRNDLGGGIAPGTLAVGVDGADAEPEARAGSKARYGEGRLCRHSLMGPRSRGRRIGTQLDYVARGLN